MTHALDGLVVLDLTRLLPGAVATRTLARFGAKVIKIEEPGSGDYARQMPPFVDGVGAVFQQTNGGKKSVAVNLKDAEGKTVLRKLVARADVLIEGFRPGVMKRLGLDFESLRKVNERLIYVALTGYGQSGPWAEMAGHDVNYLALSGVLDLIGVRGGEPVIPGVQIADLAGGALQAVVGVLLALAARTQTGRGQFVDVSMTHGMAEMLAVPLALQAAGHTPERGRMTLAGRYACYRLYQASDGRSVAVGALEPKFWTIVCRELGCQDFIADQFAGEPRQAQMIAALGEQFRSKPSEEWFEIFRQKDACVTPVRTVADFSPELRLTPLLTETPGVEALDAPLLGEHTREVLLGAGYSEEELVALEAAGSIQT